MTRLYCIYDEKAKAVCNVFCSINDKTAIRSFYDLVSDPTPTIFSQHPADFSLLYLCTVNPSANIIKDSDNLDEVLESYAVEYGSSFSEAVIAKDRENKAKWLEERSKIKDLYTYTDVKAKLDEGK